MARQTLVFGGDFSIPSSDPVLTPAKLCEGITDLLDNADFRMFQLEEAYLKTPVERSVEGNLVKSLDPIKNRVDLVTLSGNHFYDFKEAGVKDTIEWCDENGIAHAGGGMNEAEARKPAFVEKGGVKIGVLAYNAVGGKQQFAGPDQAGTAPINFHRAYKPLADLDYAQQRADRHEFDNWRFKEPIHFDTDFMGENYMDPTAIIKMAEEVREVKKQCDILIVYHHRGYVHRPVLVNDWERLLSHIAIDNGADVVMASHSHVSHGFEIYKGKAIYHGLNNFVMYTPQLAPGFKGQVHGDTHNAEWVKQRIARFGFVPDPEYPTYPFQPESIYSPVAKLIIEDGKIVSYRVVFTLTEKSGIPYVHGRADRGQEIFDYFQKITDEAGLNVKLSWDGDEAVLSEK